MRGISSTGRKQLGLITTEQALAQLADHELEYLVRSEQLVPLRRSVYRFAGVPESWEQHVLGACLAAGPDAVASFGSAGALWGLRGFDRSGIEITVPGRRNPRLADVVVHQSNHWGPEHTGRRHGVPTTSIARTLCDLTARVPPWRIGPLLDDADRRGLVTVRRVERVYRALATKGRRRSTVMRAVLADRLAGFEAGDSPARGRRRQGPRFGRPPTAGRAAPDPARAEARPRRLRLSRTEGRDRVRRVGRAPHPRRLRRGPGPRQRAGSARLDRAALHIPVEAIGDRRDGPRRSGRSHRIHRAVDSSPRPIPSNCQLLGWNRGSGTMQSAPRRTRSSAKRPLRGVDEVVVAELEDGRLLGALELHVDRAVARVRRQDVAAACRRGRRRQHVRASPRIRTGGPPSSTISGRVISIAMSLGASSRRSTRPFTHDDRVVGEQRAP